MAAEGLSSKMLVAAIVVILVIISFGASYYLISNYSYSVGEQPNTKVYVACAYYNDKSELAKISQDVVKGLKLWANITNDRGGLPVATGRAQVVLLCQPVQRDKASLFSYIGGLLTNKSLTERLVGVVLPPGNKESMFMLSKASALGSDVPLLLTYMDRDFTDVKVQANLTNSTIQIVTPMARLAFEVGDMFDYYGIRVKTLDIMYELSGRGHASMLASRLSDVLKQYNITIGISVPYTTDNSTDAVQKILKSNTNPDVVAVVADTQEAAIKAVESIKAVGIPSMKYAIVFVQDPDVSTFRERLGTALDNVMIVTYWYHTVDYGPFLAANLGYEWFGNITVEDFVRLYYNTYGDMPSEAAAVGFQAGLLIERGVKQSRGALAGIVLSKAIINSRIMTIYGPVGFEGSSYHPAGVHGAQYDHPPVILYFNEEGGKLNEYIVWPEYIATGTP
ncbi:MAG: hypothetical protein F7C35_08975 [Desulfurococcales archaeon]|nr:hypothetical protein [Desulfurococcales archaeon]